uniref:Uncharacterized protein n=1 Tax=Timema cristinae TaxID=61476 RepID=A0A7R9GP30_TIMCR|nr:unnamed protein product [Timema cristinae]
MEEGESTTKDEEDKSKEASSDKTSEVGKDDNEITQEKATSPGDSKPTTEVVEAAIENEDGFKKQESEQITNKTEKCGEAEDGKRMSVKEDEVNCVDAKNSKVTLNEEMLEKEISELIKQGKDKQRNDQTSPDNCPETSEEVSAVEQNGKQISSNIKVDREDEVPKNILITDQSVEDKPVGRSDEPEAQKNKAQEMEEKNKKRVNEKLESVQDKSEPHVAEENIIRQDSQKQGGSTQNYIKETTTKKIETNENVQAISNIKEPKLEKREVSKSEIIEAESKLPASKEPIGGIAKHSRNTKVGPKNDQIEVAPKIETPVGKSSDIQKGVKINKHIKSELTQELTITKEPITSQTIKDHESSKRMSTPKKVKGDVRLSGRESSPKVGTGAIAKRRSSETPALKIGQMNLNIKRNSMAAGCKENITEEETSGIETLQASTDKYIGVNVGIKGSKSAQELQSSQEGATAEEQEGTGKDLVTEIKKIKDIGVIHRETANTLTHRTGGTPKKIPNVQTKPIKVEKKPLTSIKGQTTTVPTEEKQSRMSQEESCSTIDNSLEKIQTSEQQIDKCEKEEKRTNISKSETDKVLNASKRESTTSSSISTNKENCVISETQKEAQSQVNDKEIKTQLNIKVAKLDDQSYQNKTTNSSVQHDAEGKENIILNNTKKESGNIKYHNKLDQEKVEDYHTVVAKKNAVQKVIDNSDLNQDGKNTQKESQNVDVKEVVRNDNQSENLPKESLESLEKRKSLGESGEHKVESKPITTTEESHRTVTSKEKDGKDIHKTLLPAYDIDNKSITSKELSKTEETKRNTDSLVENPSEGETIKITKEDKTKMYSSTSVVIIGDAKGVSEKSRSSESSSKTGSPKRKTPHPLKQKSQSPKIVEKKDSGENQKIKVCKGPEEKQLKHAIQSPTKENHITQKNSEKIDNKTKKVTEEKPEQPLVKSNIQITTSSEVKNKKESNDNSSNDAKVSEKDISHLINKNEKKVQSKEKEEKAKKLENIVHNHEELHKFISNQIQEELANTWLMNGEGSTPNSPHDCPSSQLIDPTAISASTGHHINDSTHKKETPCANTPFQEIIKRDHKKIEEHLQRSHVDKAMSDIFESNHQTEFNQSTENLIGSSEETNNEDLTSSSKLLETNSSKDQNKDSNAKLYGAIPHPPVPRAMMGTKLDPIQDEDEMKDPKQEKQPLQQTKMQAKGPGQKEGTKAVHGPGKGTGCQLYFGVKSYLHQFYDSNPAKRTQLYGEFVEDDFEYLVDPNKVRRSHCCKGFWFRAGVWGGVNLLLVGIIALLVGYLTPQRDMVVGYQDNLEILDRWAIAFNRRLELCRLAATVIEPFIVSETPESSVPGNKIPITEQIKTVQPTMWPDNAMSKSDETVIQMP